MRIKFSTCCIALALAGLSGSFQALTAFGSSRDRKIGSPDGDLIAVITSAGVNFSEDTVRMMTKQSVTRLVFPMTSTSGTNGRYVLKAKWTPDSKFFIFSTFSSAGHSSWNFRTFAYSVIANKVVSVDDLVHPITNDDFKVIWPHTVEIETLNPKGIDFTSEKVKVDVATLFRNGTIGQQGKAAEKAGRGQSLLSTQPITADPASSLKGGRSGGQSVKVGK